MPEIWMRGEYQIVLIAALSFGSVALFAFLGLSWWRRHRGTQARRLRGRLALLGRESIDAADVPGANARASQGIRNQLDALLARTGLTRSLVLLLSQAGLNWSPARMMLTSIGWGLVGGALGFFAGGGAAGVLICTVCAALLPWVYVERLKRVRLQNLEAQLPEVLDVLGRAMRSGYSFSSALRVVGEEMPEPIGPEFARTQDEVSFGIPVKDALQNLLERVPNDNLRYMVVATIVQRETGGNLAEIFSKIALLMRERIALQGQIRVLSADGRISAMILCLLPVVGAIVMFFLNRSYIARLWETSDGHRLLMLSAIMLAIGIVWMRSIVRIRV